MSRLLPCTLLAVVACTGSAPTEDPVVPAVLIPGQPAIPYPPDLFARRVEGEVLLYLVVDSSGAVLWDSSRVAKSSGHPAFDAAALDAAPGLRFTPAERAGVRVSAPIQVPIRFTIPATTRLHSVSPRGLP